MEQEIINVNEELIGKIVQVRGRVLRVLFPKKKVGFGEFAIFKFKVDQILNGILPAETLENVFYIDNQIMGDIIVKGPVPTLDTYNTYAINAKIVYDKKYGYQYDILTINTVVKLTTADDQRKFFEQVIAPTYTEALFNKFDDPISILENQDITSLTSVKGIGEATAYRLIKQYEATKDNSFAFVKLYEFGLTKHMIEKLIKEYKSADILIKKIQTNPYILINDINGIGWEKADAMALNSGISPTSKERIYAYFKYYFEDSAKEKGYTWDFLGELYNTIINGKLGSNGKRSNPVAPTLSQDLFKDYVRSAIDDGLLYYDKPTKRISLKSYRELEENIAKELIRLNSAPNQFDNLRYFDMVIKQCEEEENIKYTDEQRAAINNILNNNVSLTFGMAGTGKTSIMKPVVEILKANKFSVVSAALSGKAALNLTNVTKLDGHTIHRLLACKNVDEDGSVTEVFTDKENRETFKFNKDNQFNLAPGSQHIDVLIVDEISMVGGNIFYSLIQALPDGVKLIMLGDDRQLESIGLCNLLEDIKRSNVICCNEFTKIWRQSAESGIISDAEKIANGKQIIPKEFEGTETHGVKQDFKIIAAPPSVKALPSKVLHEFNDLYYNKHIPIEDIVVCTAMRSRGDASARVLNENIQKVLHFKSTGYDVEEEYNDRGLKYTVVYHPGDRILVTKNCYNTMNPDTHHTEPIYNGNIGTIKWISPESGMMRITFPQGDVILEKALWQNIQLGYAITTHKAQGSGIKYVIAVCDPSAYTLNCKELLYTQITRAKKYCCLIGTSAAIYRSISTTKVKNKQTWLTELLIEADKTYGK